MEAAEWMKEFPALINICDKNGILLYSNNKALKVLEKYGGEKLIGTNIINCHPDESRKKFEDMLQNAVTNSYITESKSARKFVYQAPWYNNNEYKGIVEIIMEIPAELPVFQRE